MVLYNGNYLANRTDVPCVSLSLPGKMLWSYPNNFVGVHGSHNASGPEVGSHPRRISVSLGTAQTASALLAGCIWIIGTNVGEWHILTGDGFYLTRLFEPDALKIKSGSSRSPFPAPT